MKTGDKVRFLSEKGGGVVKGFQGKDIVMVEDEDGFEIPMLKNQVVVIDEERERHAVPKPQPKPQPRSEEPEPSERPVTFRAKPVERRGGNLLNVYLGFVPSENEEGVFRMYLVNDSNYYLQTLLLSAENASWQCRFMATLEPNTKQLVEDFNRSQLNELEHLCVQLMAYKTDKTFMLKPALSVEVKLDTVKFYKVHAFQSSPFFKQPALVVDVVRDDRPQGRPNL